MRVSSLALVTLPAVHSLTRGAFTRLTPTALLGGLLGGNADKYPGAIMGDEAIMAPKAHGTSATPVQQDLRWKCSVETADKICNFNRHYAEHSGYAWGTSWAKELPEEPIDYYDSVSGKQLFRAPVGRTKAEFLKESKAHGWPSFRDAEVNWEHVRVLGDGETVSVDGTHLGHNLPDGKGNRYCINLVCVAGKPV